MQIEYNLVDIVADFVLVAATDEELPVVCEALGGWFGLQRGLVANFDRDLDPVHPVKNNLLYAPYFSWSGHLGDFLCSEEGAIGHAV